MVDPKKISNAQFIVIGVIICCILFLPFNGALHLFDWDEINFAEAAREMIVSQNYLQVQIDFQAFYQKPPLFLWLQVLSFKLFGINEFAARFPNFIAGIGTFLLIFYISKKEFTRGIAFWWSMMYAASILPHLYFRSGIIDPVYNLLIFSSLYFLYFYMKCKKFKYLLYASILIGLSTLTKGPVGLLIAGLSIVSFSIYSRLRLWEWVKTIILYGLLGQIIPLFWFFAEWINNGPEFIVEFVKYQLRLLTTEDAGHGGFPGYHFVVILIACFPASAFSLNQFFRKFKEQGHSDFILLAKATFWVVIILFSLVQSKIVHYSSMCYLPLTLLAAKAIEQNRNKKYLNTIHRVSILIIGSFWVIVSFAMANIYRFEQLIQWAGQNDNFVQSILKQDHPFQTLDNIPWIIALIALILISIRRIELNKKLLGYSILMILFTLSSILIFPSRVEYYTQRKLIEEIESFSENYTIYPGRFKSYAHLFYSKKQKGEFINPKGEQLLARTLNEDLIIFSRVERPLDTLRFTDLKLIKQIPGFNFYLKRKKE